MKAETVVVTALSLAPTAVPGLEWCPGHSQDIE